MRILLTDPVSFKFKEKLKELGEVDYKEVDETGLKKIIGEYEVVVVRSDTRVDKDTIALGKNLKVIARYGVGLDNIDVNTAKAAGIALVNAPTASSTSVAEHTIALLLAVIRQLPTANQSVLDGSWNKNSILGMELSGKTVGILGYGQVGRAVAQRLRSFGCRIIFNDIAVYDEGWTPLQEMLESSDVVCVTVPLTSETHHLIDDAKLSLLQDGAFIINTSRGGVIDMDALEKHYERLGGVGLDVYEEEPPKIRPFMKNWNVVLTPHVASNTTEARKRIGMELFDMIKLALAALE